ncbi:MAG: hypothetical protein IPJ81_10365 [Chitinophagaceae bacterium]|nr:hypothetical protein [Chitinophagaceae bacterium]
MRKSLLILMLFCVAIKGVTQIVITPKGSKVVIDSSKWNLSGSNIYNKNSGNVGFGTTNPLYKVDINATTNPIRLGGLVAGLATDSLLTTLNGVVRKTAIHQLITDSTTASNGLTLTDNDVRLGGNLTQATTLTSNSNTLTFATGGSALNITGLTRSPSTPTITDSIVMLNNSTGLLRIMHADSLLRNAWILKGNIANSTDFLGTLNNLPLNFRINNIRRGVMGSETLAAYTTLSLDGSHVAKSFSSGVTGITNSLDLGIDGNASQAVNVSGTIVGIDNLSYLRSSGSAGTLRGQRNRIWAINSNAITNTDGVFNEYRIEGVSAQLTNIKNFNTELRTTAGAKITNYYSMFNSTNGSPLVTNFYGTYFQGNTSVNNITNYYTHYQEDLGNDTKKYFLYYNGNGATTQPVVVNALGNLGLGITNPTSQLHTNGSVRFSGLGTNTTNTNMVTTDGAGNLTTRNLSSLLMPDSTTASNGLTLSGKNVQLGGNLTQATTITNNSNALTFATGGTALNITGLTAGASTDSVVTVNTATGRINRIAPGSLPNSTTASNGLTLTGTDVRLGGNLTQATTLTNNSNALTFATGGTALNITGLTAGASTDSLLTVNTATGRINQVAVGRLPDNTTASNGLTLTGTDVRLGGNLTQATTVTNNSNALTFATGGTALNITGLTAGASTDSVVTVNTATGRINQVAVGRLPDNTTASNGLTLTGTDVRLGGNLTQATTLTNNSNTLTVATGGSALNITGLTAGASTDSLLTVNTATGRVNRIATGSITQIQNVTTTNLALTLNNTHYTVIVTANVNITLPPANANKGRIYIVKKTFNGSSTISTYINTNGSSSTALPRGVRQLQSDGTNWQQIN